MSSTFYRLPLILARTLVNRPVARAIVRPAIQIRCATHATPVNRKRLKSIKETDPTTCPPIDFHAEAAKFFDSVEKAVEPMIKKNEHFVVRRTDTELSVDLGEGKGTYTFSSDDEQCIISLQSPVSGGQQYRFDTETKQWISIHDDHDVRGLLTRDLIRQCVGYPEF